ncbi:MAG: MOSC domain-containing protein [Parasphingorhabdus sp.]
MSKVEQCVTLGGIFFGDVEKRWDGKPPSAINKVKATGLQTITELGFAGDSQADLSVHGGIDKAIHHYPGDHYASWQSEGQMEAGKEPACFGENLSTHGWTEDMMCIGDIIRLGSATLQISQGRQPCWKLNSHTGNDRMAFLFQKTGRTGWYYRVLESGAASPDDLMEIIDRPCEGWTIEHVTAGRLRRKIAREDAAMLAQMPELAVGWRDAFAKFAAGNRKEDTSARLGGSDTAT